MKRLTKLLMTLALALTILLPLNDANAATDSHSTVAQPHVYCGLILGYGVWCMG